MELTEDEIIEKHATRCGHCKRNTLLPYEYERTCISCGYNVIKRKHELTKSQRKGRNFNNRLNRLSSKIFCTCTHVKTIYESNDYAKKFEVLPTLRNKKIRINNILIEKYKDILENLISNKIIVQEQLWLFAKLDMLVLD